MSATLNTAGGYRGQAWLQTAGSLYSALDFMVRQIIAGKAFAGLVKVVAVHGGGVGQPATVDVQPLVSQMNGAGNLTPHGVVYGLPCFRLQGGNGACILDPVTGDIGDAIICHRDISTVKATGQVSPPGSWRQNDWADGVYFGSVLGETPTNYVQVTQSGINVVTSGPLTFTASNATLDSDGNLSVQGEVTAGAGGADSVSLQQHRHGTGAAAAGTSVPTPGT
jgi:hypothetical protein